MAIVGRPLPHCNFNGKIYIEHVSETKFISKCTAHTNFSDDALVNVELKAMEWKSLVTNENTCEELFDFIISTYQVEDYILDRLEFIRPLKLATMAIQKKVN